ncbi:MAG: hypothetical protein IT350_04060 [Deltaproteobacteria bacterium]|nr:hypothetical protein [Deltaproteobacteria bacterium]
MAYRISLVGDPRNPVTFKESVVRRKISTATKSRSPLPAGAPAFEHQQAFMAAWIDAALDVYATKDPMPVQRFSDTSYGEAFFDALSLLLEDNFQHLADRAFYRTDENWALVNTRSALFGSERMASLAPPMQQEVARVLLRLRCENLQKVRQGDRQQALRLLTADPTWITSPAFTTMLQSDWEKFLGAEDLRADSLIRAVGRRLRGRRERTSGEIESTQHLVRRLAVSYLIAKGPQVSFEDLLVAVNNALKRRKAAKVTDDTLAAYLKGIGVLRKLAKRMRFLIDDPLGEAFVETAPYSPFLDESEFDGSDSTATSSGQQSRAEGRLAANDPAVPRASIKVARTQGRARTSEKFSEELFDPG